MGKCFEGDQERATGRTMHGGREGRKGEKGRMAQESDRQRKPGPGKTNRGERANGGAIRQAVPPPRSGLVQPRAMKRNTFGVADRLRPALNRWERSRKRGFGLDRRVSNLN